MRRMFRERGVSPAPSKMERSDILRKEVMDREGKSKKKKVLAGGIWEFKDLKGG